MIIPPITAKQIISVWKFTAKTHNGKVRQIYVEDLEKKAKTLMANR